MIITIDNIKYLQIGVFLSSHGLRGGIKFSTSINEIDNLIFPQIEEYFLIENNIAMPISILDIKVNNNNYILKIQNIDNIDAAKALTNKALYIKRDNLNLDIIPNDLLFFEVFDKNNKPYGKVIDFGDYGNGIVLEIETINDEVEAIPFSDNEFDFDIANARLILKN
jgi:16S rRNA processing protein RimM